MSAPIVPHDRGNTKQNPFEARFALTTERAHIAVDSERAYWGDNTRPDLVRLTDDADTHLLLSPAEALSLAAALQAVAVDMLEQVPA